MIKGFVLSNGQEIISEVDTVSDGIWTLVNPFKVVHYSDPSDEDSGGAALVDMCALYKDSIMVITNKHIITSYEPKDNVITYYNKVVQLSLIASTAITDKILENLDKMDEVIKERLHAMFTDGKTIH